jgi:hypothetical protein
MEAVVIVAGGGKAADRPVEGRLLVSVLLAGIVVLQPRVLLLLVIGSACHEAEAMAFRRRLPVAFGRNNCDDVEAEPSGPEASWW